MGDETRIIELTAAIDALLFDIDGDHRPDETRRMCVLCGAADGGWPCTHRMALDDLRRARDGTVDVDGTGAAP